MSRTRPSPDQIAATRPDRSNWVAANAGSGKTHVLTRRVARLLLAGAEPQKILCLTYTKAAAAEMQNRLFRLLGEWSMLATDTLAETLGDLNGGPPVRDADTLAQARRLFARALETPGGLKIQTIHAFCETLLRRFPLEAGISPRFAVADDREAQVMQATIQQDMALAAESGTDDGFDRAAHVLNEDMVGELARTVMARRAPFRTDAVDPLLTAHFGDAAQATKVDIARAALDTLDQQALSPLIRVLTGAKAKTPQGLGNLLADWITEMGKGTADPLTYADILPKALLTDANTLRKGLATKDVQDTRPQALDEIARLGDWAVDLRDRMRAVDMAARTRDLYAFGQPLLAQYEDAKAARGLMDFDDLVARAADMLTHGSMRQWVLYKLDQGIDHILVDEAQDTSPQQWEVIKAITEEFLAGEGAQAIDWSVFVVGDEKQSIYSFQGAEPKAFGDTRAHYDARLAALDRPLARPALETSYRSAPAILDFVDKVFEGDAATGLTVDATPIVHKAHRTGDQGRVDLWPLVPREEAPDPPPWWEPVDAIPASDPKARLATMVADEIASMIGTARRPAREGRPGALVTPGDILVLVSRRDQLAKGIIRGLKARGVPVAGADRLWLGDEIAVKDLLALAKVAVLPDDDLSLAALLRSPLCGMSEEDLFHLAQPRKGTLWHALRQSDHHETWAFLKDMAEQADFLRPYEFLEHALEGHDGRRRLLARLGTEAEDAIDELLTQALAYERNEPPTLTGFIAWIETGDIQIKREMDHGTGQVRVMTVHGSKGLEAPIVILPDTMSGPPGGGGRPTLLPAATGGNAPDLMLWPAAKKLDDPVTAQARAQAEARQAAERRRLLYVALTRAEDWLILCGAEPGRVPQDNWYSLIQAGMDRCSTLPFPSPTGEGKALRFEIGPEGAGDPIDTPGKTTAASPQVPHWLAPIATESPIQRAAPSGLIAHEADGGVGLGRETALARGIAVHSLLERTTSTWDPDAARTWLETQDLDPDLIPGIVAECAGVLDMPDAATLFGPDTLSEATFAIDHRPNRPRMIGRIDRIVLTPGHALIVDIKTDARPPTTADAIPRPYLAQLGAYHAAAASGWPEREIGLALLWTATPTLMSVDPATATAQYRHAIGNA